ncbi:YunG family protein [Hylemonella gracilis]|uniref:YunG family protein n=1 Tax=Hylemonella gracilis TaxID=80880 RepID=UPI003D6EFC91
MYRAIARVWSKDTSSPTGAWSPSNPAQNHCSVTSLVVQDCFGGDILSTKTANGTHFYNVIYGVNWDLTSSQFPEPIPYDDTLSTREAALSDTSTEKYMLIKMRLTNAV